MSTQQIGTFYHQNDGFSKKLCLFDKTRCLEMFTNVKVD